MKISGSRPRMRLTRSDKRLCLLAQAKTNRCKPCFLRPRDQAESQSNLCVPAGWLVSYLDRPWSIGTSNQFDKGFTGQIQTRIEFVFSPASTQQKFEMVTSWSRCLTRPFGFVVRSYEQLAASPVIRVYQHFIGELLDELDSGSHWRRACTTQLITTCTDGIR